MWVTVETQTSTSAISRVRPASTCSTFDRCVTAEASTSPVASRAAAVPATVASHISGKALLVPVDSGSSGTWPHVAAAARTVPSPPSVTITAAPRARIALTSARVSSAVPVSASSSTNSSSGRRPSLARRLASARATPPATPIPSVDSSARSTPAAPAAASNRSTMLVFSTLGNTEACATRRRMSRPDIGFATIPTVDPGTTGRPVTALTCAVDSAGGARDEGCSGVAAVCRAAGARRRSDQGGSSRERAAPPAPRPRARTVLAARSGSTTSTSGAIR